MGANRLQKPLNQYDFPVHSDSGTSCRGASPCMSPLRGEESALAKRGLTIAELRAAQKLTCETVIRELEQTKRIRDAFANAEMLKQAKQKGWSVEEYKSMVAESVFGKPKPGSKNSTYENPMFTNPTNCRIEENWDKARYLREGLPEIVYEADKKHEELHRMHCQAKPDPLEYNADMSFPEKLSKEEVKAYDVKIQYLKTWLDQNCPFSCTPSDPANAGAALRAK